MNVDQPWATLRQALAQPKCKERRVAGAMQKSCETGGDSDSSSLMCVHHLTLANGRLRAAAGAYMSILTRG